jgi:hypothetical protein
MNNPGTSIEHSGKYIGQIFTRSRERDERQEDRELPNYTPIPRISGPHSGVIDVRQEHPGPGLVSSLTAKRVVLSCVCHKGGIGLSIIVEPERMPIVTVPWGTGIPPQDPESVTPRKVC